MPEPVSALKILFVINPNSGVGDKGAWMNVIVDYFKASPHKFEWYEMTGNNDGESLRHWLKGFNPDRVVAVGGDGTLKFLAGELMYSGMPVAFLPAGSANAMSLDLGLPSDPVAMLKLAVEGTVKKIDVVRINDHISLHLSDIGLNAQLIKYFEQSGRRGMWSYVREVIKVLRRKEQIELELEINGKRVARKAWMVVIANARLYGTGIAINPHGSAFDGRFEIIVLKRLSPFEIIKMMLRNRRFNKRKTEIVSAEKVRIRTKAPVYFQVDGEYIGEVSSVEAYIEKGAVDIVVGDIPAK